MEKWHAAKPKSIAGGAPVAVEARPRRRAAAPKPPTYTEVFGNALVGEVRRDRRVVGITAAMNSGTGLNILQEAEPDHYFDVGIAEQQAVLFAAGLALEGLKPVCAIYSTFLQRAFDQIVHDVALQNLDVVFAMDRAGLVGDDGPTHHGAFDIAYLRCLPNMTLMAPRDEAMLVDMLHTAILIDEARSALRYPRGEGVGVAAAADAAADRGRHRRDPARGRPRRAARLRQRRREGARGGGPARRAGHRGDRRRRALRQAARRRAARPAARPSTSCSSRSRRACSQGGFGSAVWEHLNDSGAAAAADPARRPARPLRHARQARAAARRGRLHRPRDRAPRLRGARRRRRGRRRGVSAGPPADPRADRRAGAWRRSGRRPPPSLEALRSGYLQHGDRARRPGRAGRRRRGRRDPAARRRPDPRARLPAVARRRASGGCSSGSTAAAG